MKTKEEILLENGYEKFIGYCFKVPCAEEHELTFVDKEEVFKRLEEGVQTYYWDYDKERLLDLEEAWERFAEDYCDENDLGDLSDEELIKRLS